MKTFQKFSKNIFQYLQDNEILDFISEHEPLKEIFSEMENTNEACVIPIVFTVNPENFELDLHIIVKHEKADAYGQYEYYLIPDFVNKETNILKLLKSLAISTHADADTILSKIGEQLKEIHFQTNYDYKPFMQVNAYRAIFGLNKSSYPIPEYKPQSTISILSLDSIELKITPQDYGINDSTDEILHAIEGEFFYCDLAVDGKLIVTEPQLDKIITIENLSIHKIVESILYIESPSASRLKKVNNLNMQATCILIENCEDDLEDDVCIFKLIS